MTTREFGPGGVLIPTRAWTWVVLEHVLGLNPRGVALEFGVGSGSSTALIAARMPVFGFDSFRGLPQDWEDYPAGMFACDPPHIENATLVPGWFADTLPHFDFAALDIGLVHIDCDLYSSTVTVLEHVGPHLRPGCYLIFDEWIGHDDEPRAWREYTDTHPGLEWRVVACSDQPWAIQLL